MSDTGKLYSKLAEIVLEVGYVAKDGKNDFQNYRYTSAEALLAAIRDPLAKRQLILMPSLTALSERDYTTSKGKVSVITTAHVKFTIVDGETGERHECEWAGQGDDPGDKGLGKAYTNAIKTFLREQFLIPQGDDPEADKSTDERSQDRAPQQRNGGNGHTATAAPVQQTDRPASAKQRSLIFARAGEQSMAPSLLANVVLLATGNEAREWDDEESAQTWLGRSLDRLPAKAVNKVLEGIAGGS